MQWASDGVKPASISMPLLVQTAIPLLVQRTLAAISNDSINDGVFIDRKVRDSWTESDPPWSSRSLSLQNVCCIGLPGRLQANWHMRHGESVSRSTFFSALQEANTTRMNFALVFTWLPLKSGQNERELCHFHRYRVTVLFCRSLLTGKSSFCRIVRSIKHEGKWKQTS